MGIRETLNQRPELTTRITIGVIVAAVGIIVFQMFFTKGPADSGYSSKAYFTTDDGAGYFPDEIGHIPPYDKGGRVAVRARVFSCDGGTTRFVAYLERYSAESIDQHRKFLAENKEPGAIATAPNILSGGSEVKPPKSPSAEWVSVQNMEGYARVVSVTCPDGKGDPLEIYPE